MRGEDTGYEDCQQFSNLNMEEKGPDLSWKGFKKHKHPAFKFKDIILFLVIRLLGSPNLMKRNKVSGPVCLVVTVPK